MPSFAYCAIDNHGTRHTGHADAPTPGALALALEERGLVVVDVAANHDSRAGNSEAYRHSNRAALIDVTRALAGLLSAGLPLSRAIAAAASTSQQPMSEHLSTIRDRVARGDALATALAAHAETFPPLYLGLVRAGERSGDLAGAFTRLATQLEREDELRSKLLSAAIYPALLAVVGTTAVLVLLLFVLPRFAGVLEGAGAHLPRSTQLLLTASAAARHYWLLLLLPPVAVTLGAIWVKSSREGARAWATTLFSLPMIGTLRRDQTAAQFARMMSVLLGGGAPVIGALDDVARRCPIRSPRTMSYACAPVYARALPSIQRSPTPPSSRRYSRSSLPLEKKQGVSRSSCGKPRSCSSNAPNDSHRASSPSPNR
jgi:type II secretory pathway component PulF